MPSTFLRTLTLFCSLFICLLSVNKVLAQTATSSPYSRYGLGNIYSKDFSQGFALGGTTIAMQNDTMPLFFINTANPASYPNIRLTTIEVGLNYTRTMLYSSNAKSKSNSAAFNYVALAFPIKKWWAASIGLIPYSSVGYKISDQQVIDNVGKINFLYEGSGGFNQAYFGNGIKPFYGMPRMFMKSNRYKALISKYNAEGKLKTPAQVKEDKETAEKLLLKKKRWQEFNVGVNVSYLFGNIENSGRSIVPSSYMGFNTRTFTTKRVNDIYLDYGAQYAFTIYKVKKKNYIYDTLVYHNPDSLYYTNKRLNPLKPHTYRELNEKVKILVGANFAAQSNLNAKIDSLSYSYFTNNAGYEIGKDTVVNTQGVKGKISLPLSFGFGLGFKKGDRWLVAADFAMQNWSSYQAFNQTRELKNSMRVSLGAQWIPDSKAISTYYKRMYYRLGARYYQTAIEIKNTRLTEYAAVVGVGFPVARNTSMVNLALEFGTRGTLTNGLIKENFMKATIGFTINDRWFIKPKFD